MTQDARQWLLWVAYIVFVSGVFYSYSQDKQSDQEFYRHFDEILDKRSREEAIPKMYATPADVKELRDYSEDFVNRRWRHFELCLLLALMPLLGLLTSIDQRLKRLEARIPTGDNSEVQNHLGQSRRTEGREAP